MVRITFGSKENRSFNSMNPSVTLKIIPQTLLETERTFSAKFITKIRNKLSDKCIDCLCFLKSYYKNRSLIYFNCIL